MKNRYIRLLTFLSMVVATLLISGCNDSNSKDERSDSYHPKKTVYNKDLRGITTSSVTTTDDILDITFSTDGTKIYAAGHSLGIHILDKDTLHIQNTIDTYGLAHDITPLSELGYYVVADQNGGLIVYKEVDNSLEKVTSYADIHAMSIATIDSNHIAVSSGDDGVVIFSFDTTTNSLMKVSSYDTVGYAHGVYHASFNGYLYVSSTSHGVDKIDISNINNPTLVKTFTQPSNAHAATVTQDGVLVVAARDKGIYVKDLTTVEDGIFIDTKGDAVGVDFFTKDNKKYMIVSDGNKGISLVDITDSSDPQYAIYEDTDGYSHQAAVEANKLFLSDSNYGLNKMDLSQLDISYIGNKIILNNRTFYGVKPDGTQFISIYNNDGKTRTYNAITQNYTINDNTLVVEENTFTLQNITTVKSTNEYYEMLANYADGTSGVNRLYKDKAKANSYASGLINDVVITYSWQISDWTVCTGDCGTNNGTQSRTVTCEDSNAESVSDSYCTDLKPDISQSCTANQCEEEQTTITSNATGRIWMDRNLGASQECTSFDDELCYGDYYQWGRETDGHEKSNSSTTSIQATNVLNVGHGNFITDLNWDYSGDWAKEADSDGAIRSTNWNPCPTGFKIPTIDELIAENIHNSGEAYSKLKLPSAGSRDHDDGMQDQGSNGYLWSSSVIGSTSENFNFYSSYVDWGDSLRAHGESVRCIKEQTEINDKFAIAIDSTVVERGLYPIFDGTNYLFGIQNKIATDSKASIQFISQSGILESSLILGSSSEQVTGGIAYDGTNYLTVWLDDTNTTNGKLINNQDLTVISSFTIDGTVCGVTYGGGNYLVMTYVNDSLIGRIISSLGIVGDAFTINSSARPDVGISFDGTNFLVIWTDDSNDTEVKGRFVTPNGVLGVEFTVNDSLYHSDNPLYVAFDGTNYLIVWDDQVGGFPDGTWDLYGQLVSKSGVLVGDVISVSTAPGHQMAPTIAFDGINYLVTWTDMRNDLNYDENCDVNEGTCWDIYGQHISTTGTLIGEELPLITDDGNQFGSIVFGGGKYFLLYNNVDILFGERSDIYGMFITP